MRASLDREKRFRGILKSPENAFSPTSKVHKKPYSTYNASDREATIWTGSGKIIERDTRFFT